MGRFTDMILGTPEQREHNARFNNGDTDPEGDEFVASNDQADDAEKAAKKSLRG